MVEQWWNESAEETEILRENLVEIRFDKLFNHQNPPTINQIIKITVVDMGDFLLDPRTTSILFEDLNFAIAPTA